MEKGRNNFDYPSYQKHSHRLPLESQTQDGSARQSAESGQWQLFLCRARPPHLPRARRPARPLARSPARPHPGAALPARPPASSHRQVRMATVAVGHGSDDSRPPAAPAAALPALGTRVLAGRHAQEPLPHQLRPRLRRHGRRCAAPTGRPC